MAARLAMSCLLNGKSILPTAASRPIRYDLDGFIIIFTQNYTLNKNPGRMYIFRSNFTDRNNLFYFGNRYLSSGSHNWIKVLGAHSVYQISTLIPLPGLNKSIIRPNGSSKMYSRPSIILVSFPSATTVPAP